MIYSVHNPVTGMFEYFEGGPDTPLNDDLPTPRLARSSHGVAATAAGRPLPPGSVAVGTGVLPVGSISSGEPGLWMGSAKGGIPSGLGQDAEEGLGQQASSAITTVLIVGAVGSGAAALLSEDTEQRWKWGIIAAAAAAWPVWSWVKGWREQQADFYG